MDFVSQSLPTQLLLPGSLCFPKYPATGICDTVGEYLSLSNKYVDKFSGQSRLESCCTAIKLSQIKFPSSRSFPTVAFPTGGKLSEHVFSFYYSIESQITHEETLW